MIKNIDIHIKKIRKFLFNAHEIYFSLPGEKYHKSSEMLTEVKIVYTNSNINLPVTFCYENYFEIEKEDLIESEIPLIIIDFNNTLDDLLLEKQYGKNKIDDNNKKKILKILNIKESNDIIQDIRDILFTYKPNNLTELYNFDINKIIKEKIDIFNKIKPFLGIKIDSLIKKEVIFNDISIINVMIYSYIFGPYRMHEYNGNNIQDIYKNIKKDMAENWDFSIKPDIYEED